MNSSTAVDFGLFRRDVYQLAAILGTYERLSGMPELDKFADSKFEGVMFRQFLLVAISARRLLEASGLRKSGELIGECGTYSLREVNKGPGRDKHATEDGTMYLKRACDSIIHAEARLIMREEGEFSPRFELSGEYVTHLKTIQETRKVAAVAKLTGDKFLECCVNLRDELASARITKTKTAKKRPVQTGRLN